MADTEISDDNVADKTLQWATEVVDKRLHVGLGDDLERALLRHYAGNPYTPYVQMVTGVNHHLDPLVEGMHVNPAQASLSLGMAGLVQYVAHNSQTTVFSDPAHILQALGTFSELDDNVASLARYVLTAYREAAENISSAARSRAEDDRSALAIIGEVFAAAVDEWDSVDNLVEALSAAGIGVIRLPDEQRTVPSAVVFRRPSLDAKSLSSSPTSRELPSDARLPFLVVDGDDPDLLPTLARLRIPPDFRREISDIGKSRTTGLLVPAVPGPYDQLDPDRTLLVKAAVLKNGDFAKVRAAAAGARRVVTSLATNDFFRAGFESHVVPAVDSSGNVDPKTLIFKRVPPPPLVPNVRQKAWRRITLRGHMRPAKALAFALHGGGLLASEASRDRVWHALEREDATTVPAGELTFVVAASEEFDHAQSAYQAAIASAREAGKRAKRSWRRKRPESNDGGEIERSEQDPVLQWAQAIVATGLARGLNDGNESRLLTQRAGAAGTPHVDAAVGIRRSAFDHDSRAEFIQQQFAGLHLALDGIVAYVRLRDPSNTLEPSALLMSLHHLPTAVATEIEPLLRCAAQQQEFARQCVEQQLGASCLQDPLIGLPSSCTPDLPHADRASAFLSDLDVPDSSILRLPDERTAAALHRLRARRGVDKVAARVVDGRNEQEGRVPTIVINGEDRAVLRALAANAPLVADDIDTAAGSCEVPLRIDDTGRHVKVFALKGDDVDRIATLPPDLRRLGMGLVTLEHIALPFGWPRAGEPQQYRYSRLEAGRDFVLPVVTTSSSAPASLHLPSGPDEAQADSPRLNNAERGKLERTRRAVAAALYASGVEPVSYQESEGVLTPTKIHEALVELKAGQSLDVRLKCDNGQVHVPLTIVVDGEKAFAKTKRAYDRVLKSSIERQHPDVTPFDVRGRDVPDLSDSPDLTDPQISLSGIEPTQLDGELSVPPDLFEGDEEFDSALDDVSDLTEERVSGNRTSRSTLPETDVEHSEIPDITDDVHPPTEPRLGSELLPRAFPPKRGGIGR